MAIQSQRKTKFGILKYFFEHVFGALDFLFHSTFREDEVSKERKDTTERRRSTVSFLMPPVSTLTQVCTFLFQFCEIAP